MTAGARPPLRVVLMVGLILSPAIGLAQARASHHGAAPTAAEAARDSSALTGPLAVGATVRDPAGEVLGRITRLTTAASGATLVMVRKGVDSFAIPADRLRITGDGVWSSLDREGIRALGDSATR